MPTVNTTAEQIFLIIGLGFFFLGTLTMFVTAVTHSQLKLSDNPGTPAFVAGLIVSIACFVMMHYYQ